MPRKIISYIATSINNKIARKDGDVAWLEEIPNPENSDYGYSAFYETIDTTIQGYSTYALVKSWNVPFPYPTKKNFVVTRKSSLDPAENVEFITADHIEFIRNLKAAEGKDIWLIGGGQLNTMFLNAGLLDEMIVFVMPIIIPDGIDLFEGHPNQTSLKLKSSKGHSSGVIETHYTV